MCASTYNSDKDGERTIKVIQSPLNGHAPLKMNRVLYRIYWNNDSTHSFDVGEEHVCSESLPHESLYSKHPHFKPFRWTAPTIEGGCEPVKKVGRFCEKYGFELQISNEMRYKPGFNCPFGLNGWIENRLKTNLHTVNFKIKIPYK